MWKRKSQREIDALKPRMRRRYSTPVAKIASVVIFFLVLVVSLEFDSSLAMALNYAALVAVVCYMVLKQLEFFCHGGTGESLIPKTLICSECHRRQISGGRQACQCGGGLEPIWHWEWHEDPSTSKPIEPA